MSRYRDKLENRQDFDHWGKLNFINSRHQTSCPPEIYKSIHSSRIHLLSIRLQLATSCDKMPKYFCDYCDVYLTHDSMSVRKAHNSGRNHLRNVVDYYQQIGHEKAQSVIDSITSSYADAGQQMPVPGGMMQHSFGGGMPGPPPGFPAGMPPFPPPGGFPGGPGGMAPRE